MNVKFPLSGGSYRRVKGELVPDTAPEKPDTPAPAKPAPLGKSPANPPAKDED